MYTKQTYTVIWCKVYDSTALACIFSERAAKHQCSVASRRGARAPRHHSALPFPARTCIGILRRKVRNTDGERRNTLVPLQAAGLPANV